MATCSPGNQFPPPINLVFLKNPSPCLLKVLGKTKEDCSPDLFGRDIQWLELPALPDGIEIYYGLEETYFVGEIEDEDPSVEVPAIPEKHLSPKAPLSKAIA